MLDEKTFEDDGVPYGSMPDKEFKNDWWNPKWIPVTYDGSGNYYFLDLDPADGGTYGQVITMCHDDSRRTLVANSFGEWIKEYNIKLQSGMRVFSEDYLGIVDKELDE